MPKWTPAPLSMGAYADNSRASSDQDIVNLLVCPAEKQGTRTRVPLRSIPGQQEFASLGTVRRQRGAYVAEGRLFVVADTSLYEIKTNGSAAFRGVVPGTTRISAAHNKITNGNQVKFVTGAWGGIYDTTTDTLTQITHPSYSSEKQVRYIGSLFVGAENNGRYVVVSDLANGLSYNALEIFDGESSPDLIVAVEPSHGELVMFNERTIEHFAYTGQINELFQNKIATIDVGLASPHAVNLLDNHLYFVGADGTPYYLDGYTERRIGTHALEQAWAKCSLSKCYSFPWEDRGWKLWIVTFPDGKTWAYDIAASAQTGEPVWVRFQSYGMDRWRPAWVLKWNGAWYSGEHNSGRIFRLSWDYFREGADVMERRVRTGVLHSNANRLSLNALRAEVDAAGPDTVATAVNSVLTFDQTQYRVALAVVGGGLPDCAVGDVINFRYATIGGSSPITFAVTAGALPAGLTLSTSGAITGTTITANNNNAWTVTATDSNGVTASLVETQYVLDMLGSIANAVNGAVVSTSFTGTQGTAPYTFAVTSGALPTGLALASGGAVTGTLTTVGTFTYSIKLTDVAGVTQTKMYTTAVSAAIVPTFLNGADFYSGTPTTLTAYTGSFTGLGGQCNSSSPNGVVIACKTGSGMRILRWNGSTYVAQTISGTTPGVSSDAVRGSCVHPSGNWVLFGSYDNNAIYVYQYSGSNTYTYFGTIGFAGVLGGAFKDDGTQFAFTGGAFSAYYTRVYSFDSSTGYAAVTATSAAIGSLGSSFIDFVGSQVVVSGLLNAIVYTASTMAAVAQASSGRVGSQAFLSADGLYVYQAEYVMSASTMAVLNTYALSGTFRQSSINKTRTHMMVTNNSTNNNLFSLSGSTMTNLGASGTTISISGADGSLWTGL